MRFDVPVLVEVDLSLEHAGVGDVADTEKQPADRQDGLGAGDGVAQLQADHLLLLDAQHLLDRSVGAELDVRMTPSPAPA